MLDPLMALVLALGLWAAAIVYCLRSARREAQMRLRQARLTGQRKSAPRRDPGVRFPH